LCAGAYETDAVSLVEIARRRFAADPDYDCVYVVCDADRGGSLEKAIALASRPMKGRDGRRITVNVVCSDPCIEFWLLLHFEYSSRPYRNAAEVTADLKRHLTNYSKSDPQLFRHVEAGIDRAVANVKRLRRELAASGAQSPGSDIDQLIGQLLRMRRSSQSIK
jgi:RloB-like protein